MKQKTKNLILYIFMCTLVISLSYMFIRLSNIRKNQYLETSYIKSYLSEIKYDDIKTNLVERPDSVIYVSDSSSGISKKFEKKFAKVIKKYNLENDIIFINIYGIGVEDLFYKNAPELLFYQNKEVSDAIDCSLLKSEKDIIKLLKERGIIND